MSEKLLEQYIKTLTADELKVIDIAKSSLGSSFDLSKSIGFKKWLNKI